LFVNIQLQGGVDSVQR